MSFFLTLDGRSPELKLQWSTPASSECQTVIYGYIGIMEKKMETIGIIGIIMGYILGLYRDNGKENGNY